MRSARGNYGVAGAELLERAVNDQDRRRRAVGHALRDASERSRTAQSATADDENIGVACGMEEGVHGARVIELHLWDPPPDVVDIEILPPQAGDDSELSAKAVYKLIPDGQRVVRLWGAVEADDNAVRKERLGDRKAGDQHGTRGRVEQLARDPAQEDLREAAMAVRSEGNERRALVNELMEQRRRGRPAHNA